MLVEVLGQEPAMRPPTSLTWPKIWEKPIRRSCQKIGVTTQ
jgi:hypothetical protein